MLENPVALLVAILGSAGAGGFLREIVSGLLKLRSGVSAKESNRKRDLVSERNYYYDAYQIEARNRRTMLEYAVKLRRPLLERGLDNLVIEWPTLEEVSDFPKDKTGPIPTKTD